MISATVRALTAFVMLAAATATTFPTTCVSADPETEAGETARLLEEEVIHTLQNGSPRERLRAAEEISITLELGTLGRDDPSRPLDDLADSLILVLRQETDDWIARTLLDSLLWEDNPALNRLFREALRSGSVNVRAMGIRHLEYREDPQAVEALESLWEHDLPKWVRASLVEALAEHGSAAHLDDFMRLTRDDDPEVREAAIEALDTLARPEAIPVLVRVAHGEALTDRVAALRALGAFPDSDEAIEEALRASRSEERPVFRAAVDTLGRLGHPDGDDRLIALLGDPPDLDLRGALVAVLENSKHPDATAALVRLLHQRDVAPDSWIASTVVRVLHNRDDAEAVPGLLDLAGDPGKYGRDEIGELNRYLSRDRSAGGHSVIVSTGCSFGAPVTSHDPRAWHVAPTPPFETIRCWDGPDRVGDPEDRPRVPGGTLVLITDHFEAPDQPWVEIEGSESDDCWVPLDNLQKGPGPPEPTSWPRHHIRHEFDIGTEELESPHASRLCEAGLLDIFEPGDEVAGVALELDAFAEDQVDLVRALLPDSDTLLDAALRFVLDQVDPGGATDGDVSDRSTGA